MQVFACANEEQNALILKASMVKSSSCVQRFLTLSLHALFSLQELKKTCELPRLTGPGGGPTGGWGSIDPSVSHPGPGASEHTNLPSVSLSLIKQEAVCGGVRDLWADCSLDPQVSRCFDETCLFDFWLCHKLLCIVDHNAKMKSEQE